MPENKQATLVLLTTEDSILLGMKKRGFGVGKYNGFGGKIESGETIMEAAAREMKEESGIDIEEATYAGRIIFEFEGDLQKLEVHIFRVCKYHGIPTESEEMRPQWYPLHNIPFDDMWKDDRIWMPLLLAGRKFDGYFLFRGHEEIVSYELKEVETMPYEVTHVFRPS